MGGGYTYLQRFSGGIGGRNIPLNKTFVKTKRSVAENLQRPSGKN
jgi:hypothetical protein